MTTGVIIPPRLSSPPAQRFKVTLQVLLIALSACWLLWHGAEKAPRYSVDFLPVYTGARCMLHACNPYDTAQLDAQYFESGGLAEYRPEWYTTPPVYPPSIFVVVAPLAMLKLGVAERLWAGLNGLLLIACVVFLWSMTPPASRWLATVLASCFLFSNESIHLMASGQPAGFAIPLLIIAALLFLCDRYIPLATVLLTLSLAVKPQIGGMIVLYLIFRKIHWRAVILAAAASLAILLVGGWILKSHPASAQWPSDLRAQMADSLEPGNTNDPRPPTRSAVTFANLQVVAAVFTSNPKVYGAVSYAVFLALMIVWTGAVARNDSSLASHWLALAALAALSMLPIYHRDYDARLLILALPAISIIYLQRRWLGWLLIAMTLLHIFSDYLQRRIQYFFEHHLDAQSILQNKFVFLMLMRQQALQLLCLTGLYLVAMFVVRPAADTKLEESPVA